MVDELERSTAEVKRLRELRKADKERIASLERQVAEYKTSNKLIDQAYIDAQAEITQLRVAVERYKDQIETLEARVANLKKEVQRLKGQVSFFKKLAGLGGGSTLLLLLFLL